MVNGLNYSNKMIVDFFSKRSLSFGEKRIIDFLDKGAVLELGCGGGVICFFLEEHGFKVTGIDLEKEMISVCKKYKKARGSNVDFFVHDFFKPFNKKFDNIIFMKGSINADLAVKDFDDLFSNVYSSLKKGGVFIFEIIPKYSPFLLIRKEYYSDKIFNTKIGKIPYHFYSGSFFKKKLFDAGFSSVKYVSYLSLRTGLGFFNFENFLRGIYVVRK